MIQGTLKFGHFRFIPRQRLLLAGNEEVRIGNRALDILAALVERAGELVTKDELIACVWPRSVVAEINLRVHIAALRRALGDGQAQCPYILNTVGRGYTFIAPVTCEASEAPPQCRSFGQRCAMLPVPLNRMFGRSRDLDVLIARAKTSRLVNIVGPAGVGKSALALVAANQLAAYFKSGCQYVDFATISDSSLVTDALATAVGVKMTASKPQPDLVGILKTQHCLVVFDNCDHVIDAVALLSERLLKGTPLLHILATSREALGAEAECQYFLHPLDVPDEREAKTADAVAEYSAVRLFVDRAAASLPTFALNDSNARYVVDICRRVDGIPLAIDLSAAQVSLIEVHDIASHLDAQLLEAINDHGSAVPWHRTMRAAFDWSIERLSVAEKILLRRLCVFRGAFTFDSAVSLAARQGLDQDEVTQGIMSLTAKSLMRTVIISTKTHHRLLRTTRNYLFQKLVSSPDAPMIDEWHARAILKTLHKAGVTGPTMPPSQWIEDYRYIVEDARAAVKWAFSEKGDALIGERITAALGPLACEIDSDGTLAGSFAGVAGVAGTVAMPTTHPTYATS